MVIIWLLHGYYMVIIWLLYGYYMVIIWLIMGIYEGFHLFGGTTIAGWSLGQGNSCENMDDDWGYPLVSLFSETPI